MNTLNYPEDNNGYPRGNVTADGATATYRTYGDGSNFAELTISGFQYPCTLWQLIGYIHYYRDYTIGKYVMALRFSTSATGHVKTIETYPVGGTTDLSNTTDEAPPYIEVSTIAPIPDEDEPGA